MIPFLFAACKLCEIFSFTATRALSPLVLSTEGMVTRRPLGQNLSSSGLLQSSESEAKVTPTGGVAQAPRHIFRTNDPYRKDVMTPSSLTAFSPATQSIPRPRGGIG
jgi:hypothetical protein